MTPVRTLPTHPSCREPSQTRGPVATASRPDGQVEETTSSIFLNTILGTSRSYRIDPTYTDRKPLAAITPLPPAQG
jgi:hypothetical protein